jgi:hypothetical protein
MPPSDNPELLTLKAISNKSMYNWTQAEVDLVVAFLQSRGCRLSATTQSRGIIYRYPTVWGDSSLSRHKIIDARFITPETPGTCGAQKALKRVLRANKGNTEIKQIVAKARTALFKEDYAEVEDLLERLNTLIGG